MYVLWENSLFENRENIHHETSKFIYESNDTHENLFLLSNMVSMHQRHLRFLITEYIEVYLSVILNLCGPIPRIKTCVIV